MRTNSPDLTDREMRSRALIDKHLKAHPWPTPAEWFVIAVVIVGIIVAAAMLWGCQPWPIGTGETVDVSADG